MRGSIKPKAHTHGGGTDELSSLTEEAANSADTSRPGERPIAHTIVSTSYFASGFSWCYMSARKMRSNWWFLGTYVVRIVFEFCHPFRVDVVLCVCAWLADRVVFWVVAGWTLMLLR